jgi:hypothetical protein
MPSDRALSDWWSAAIFAAGAVICGLLLHRSPGLEPVVQLAPA